MKKQKIMLFIIVFALAVLVTPAAGAVAETWVFQGYAVGKQPDNETALGVFMPEVIRLDNGTYRMYYGAQEQVVPPDPPGGACIKYAESADAISWVVKGLVLQGASDPSDPDWDNRGPSVVKLPDGRYRMYYQASPQQAPGEFPKFTVRSAISDDGINFTKEGVRLNINAYDASSTLRLAGHGSFFIAADGTYAGIFSGEFTSDPFGHPSDLKMATSADGLTFGNFTTLYVEWHDPVVIQVNGGYKMYATYLLEKSGLAFSPDGLNWPGNMTDMKFVDANGNPLSEGADGIGDIGGVLLPSGGIRLFTNFGNPSENIVYFDRQKQPGAGPAADLLLLTD